MRGELANEMGAEVSDKIAESTSNEAEFEDDIPHVDLKNPGIAAFWAWFWPGAGHFYQGRTAKGLVFMVAILTTYFFGLVIGKGNVVYASFRSDDWRLQYYCQVGVGLPALPAIVQAVRVGQRQRPLFNGIMAPPKQIRGSSDDELSQWHKRPNMSFEMGTLYTMVAGLLNILAVCDAYAGPLLMSSDEKKKRAREAVAKKRSEAASTKSSKS